jgi:hypothetical protein
LRTIAPTLHAENVDELIAFAGAVLALRLAGALAARWRRRRAPELALWTAAFVCYALACAALAWGAAAGWDTRVFRVYYLFGGLLTAPLLGAGSILLLRRGRGHVVAATAAYVGLAAGIVLAVPFTQRVESSGIPSAQHHFDFFPARAIALIGNTVGTLAVVGIALHTIRRRPVGNALIIGGIAVAAIGSALPRIGEGATAALLTAGVVLLYAGFVIPHTSQMWRRLTNFSRGTAF